MSEAEMQLSESWPSLRSALGSSPASQQKNEWTEQTWTEGNDAGTVAVDISILQTRKPSQKVGVECPPVVVEIELLATKLTACVCFVGNFCDIYRPCIERPLKQERNDNYENNEPTRLT